MNLLTFPRITIHLTSPNEIIRNFVRYRRPYILHEKELKKYLTQSMDILDDISRRIKVRFYTGIAEGSASIDRITTPT